MASSTNTDVETNEQLEHDKADHPGVGQYIEIGIILAVVTAMEVALYFMDIARVIVVPSLLILTLIKFVLVVLWFMHLRFDSAWFRRVFLFGLTIAVVVFSITISMFVLGPS